MKNVKVTMLVGALMWIAGIVLGAWAGAQIGAQVGFPACDWAWAGTVAVVGAIGWALAGSGRWARTVAAVGTMIAVGAVAWVGAWGLPAVWAMAITWFGGAFVEVGSNKVFVRKGEQLGW